MKVDSFHTGKKKNNAIKSRGDYVVKKKPGEIPEAEGLYNELKTITSIEDMWALSLLIEEAAEIDEIELASLNTSPDKEYTTSAGGDSNFSEVPLKGYVVREIFL